MRLWHSAWLVVRAANETLAKGCIVNLFMPLIGWLIRKDRNKVTDFRESAMITGLTGTARKRGRES